MTHKSSHIAHCLYDNFFKIFINGCELSLFLYSSCEMHTLASIFFINNVMSDHLSLFLMSSNTGLDIPGHCPGYFESCILTSRGPDAKMWSPAYVVHRRMYSVQCSDKIQFPQLRIKCGIAKSCLGTHTALQAPMESTCTSILTKLTLVGVQNTQSLMDVTRWACII